MPVPDFDVAQDTLGEIAQSLLEVRKQARSIENTALSFMPLTDNDAVKDELTHLAEAGVNAAKLANSIYQRIARRALGGGQK